MNRYPIPAGTSVAEQIIQRSRFITTLARAGSSDEAREAVAAVRAEHPGATHNCFAFVAGSPGSTAQIGMSDDGEPAGTAGRPMLAVLLGSGVGDVLAVTTRYYGGIKLGTGGLVRAYGGSVKAALAQAPLVEKVTRVILLLSADYRTVNPLERLFPHFEAEIVARDFGEIAGWRLSLPEERVQELVNAVQELSAGGASWQVL
jgi:uncharacterized YigZ family protein